MDELTQVALSFGGVWFSPRFVPQQGKLKSLSAIIIHVSHHCSFCWPERREASQKSVQRQPHVLNRAEVET